MITLITPFPSLSLVSGLFYHKIFCTLRAVPCVPFWCRFVSYCGRSYPSLLMGNLTTKVVLWVYMNGVLCTKKEERNKETDEEK